MYTWQGANTDDLCGHIQSVYIYIYMGDGSIYDIGRWEYICMYICIHIYVCIYNNFTLHTYACKAVFRDSVVSTCTTMDSHACYIFSWSFHDGRSERARAQLP